MCHADNTWKTGPAFRDVAASYRMSRKPANTMVRLIRQGQHGEGPWHMPPHSEAGLADAKAMADYILSLP
jgi:cytochrome c551/c552